jgi:choline-sulfatase
MQIDHDEEVVNNSIQKIYDFARDSETKPFFLVTSLTHPHDPYVITPEYWNRYEHNNIDMPSVSKIKIEDLDIHSRGIHNCYRMGRDTITEEHIRRARHGYYAAISYVDDKIGQLMEALEMAGFKDNTIVIFTSDHGDMMGERGLWYKKSFWEWSARVPLIFHAPNRFKSRSITKNVSLVDLFPTIIELSGGNVSDAVEPIDGHSLCNLLQGKENGWSDTVYCEVLSEGVLEPHVMIRRGQFKYIYGNDGLSMLFDLFEDPKEINDLSGHPDYADVKKAFVKEIQENWDLKALKQKIIQNQKNRLLIFKALMAGKRHFWEFQPFQDASKKYTRSGELTVEAEGRYHLPL